MRYLVLISAFLFFSMSLFAQNQDCETSLVLLTKDSITVDEINGSGTVNDMINNNCYDIDMLESQSSWYKFTAVEAGNFYFTIKPQNPLDDLDFYLLKATAETCASAVSVRCNASSCLGDNGYTGISPDEDDVFEDLNCDDGENGFVKDVQLNTGDTYYLMVNNFTGNSGYTIVFCGTARFSEDDVVCTNEVSNQEIYSEKEFRITPNPVYNSISISDYQEVDKIDVYSSQGALIMQRNQLQERMEMNLLPGMYYCKIYTKQGTIAVVPFVQL